VSAERRVDAVVVGAGQAGLTMSWWLARAGRDHVVVDRRSRLGGGWLDRWDSFRLVSPNWTASFPGDPYAGTDPDGFMTRDEIGARIAGYAERIEAPVELDTDVRHLTPRDGRLRLETSQGPIDADLVIVATGGFHRPIVPAIAAAMPGRLLRIHSHEYRSEAALPPGGVLVVGSGQSGVQIAEELFDAGRRVALVVGSAGRVPRRYRGSDIFRWLHALVRRGGEFGTALPTAASLPDPRLRRAGNPHLSGHGGGHDTNLRQFARDGMTLLGRITDVDGEVLRLAPDLPSNLAWADRFFDERFRQLVDDFVERAGIDAPPDDRVPVDFEPPVRESFDLAAEGIGSVIWTTGYDRDYGWIEPSVVDEMGFPRQTRGVAEVPGLYFIGSLWQHNQGSATLFGVAVDARELAVRMGIAPADNSLPDASLPDA
jgi:putative flavoprotein involved in K+ transport